MNYETYEDFASFVSERIAKLRNHKNVSARDMSLSLGLGEAYINHIENNSNMPSMKNFYYICEFLKISPKDFFDDDTEAPDLLAELITACKKLDRRSMQNLLEFIKNTTT